MGIAAVRGQPTASLPRIQFPVVESGAISISHIRDALNNMLSYELKKGFFSKIKMLVICFLWEYT